MRRDLKKRTTHDLEADRNNIKMYLRKNGIGGLYKYGTG
jgi:hypothetical protein